VSAGLVLALGASPASAGDYNWGTNGSGACNQGSPNAGTEWNQGNCVMALSGWANVKPLTIMQATVSCEDTVSGPYPTATPGSNQSPSNLQPGPFYFAYEWWAGMQSGWAWQGSDISGDSPTGGPTEGQFDPTTGTVITWGSASGAFGNGTVYTKQAQYAAGCLNAYGAGEVTGSISSSREPHSDGSSAMSVSVRHNPNPAERLIISRGKAGTRMVTRRVTLRPNRSRTVRVACPARTKRIGQDTWIEYAPANGRAPSASSIAATRLSIANTGRLNGRTVAIRTGRLVHTTMLQLQITCR
jgi:hypothetical protein